MQQLILVWQDEESDHCENLLLPPIELFDLTWLESFGKTTVTYLYISDCNSIVEGKFVIDLVQLGSLSNLFKFVVLRC